MKRILFAMLISMLGLSFQSMAQGDLLVTPSRVVFEGNKQKEELNLVNIGNDTTIYSITFVQRKMNEDGSFVTIETPDSGQMFADPFLRVFPRKVTLAPGEPQTVMVQYRRKADMLPGEYRSHLYFRSEKNYNPLGMGKLNNDSTLLSVQLIPIFGITIPVIIRTGDVKMGASMSDLKLDLQQDTIHSLKLTIHRTGNISVYGDLIVQYTPVQGKPYEIGSVRGMGVYTGINKRNITVRLNNTPGNTFKTGKLKVQYVSNGESKKVVYAEGELVL